jgi:acetolactate synthase-1/2/3 large subunit
MNGAQIVIKTAVKAGIKICFANPGTTEMPLVEALDSVPGIQAKLGLFEGCCTGAADGYARMTGSPALTLLHLGPGLANGIANLHNAHRAKTPVVNIIGDHASWHRPADAPLSMDIQTLAGVIPGWQRTSTCVESLSQDMADAISAAMAGQVATLIIPQDFQWGECADHTICIPCFSYDPVDDDLIKSAAVYLKQGEKTLVILGGHALRKEGLTAAARIQSKTGCDLMSDSFPAHTHIGAGLPALNRVPYFPEPAIETLSQYQTIIRIGTKPIVSFFGYKDVNCQLLSSKQTVINLSPGSQDLLQVLDCLADHAGAPMKEDMGVAFPETPDNEELPQGKLTGGTICQILSSMVPENSIVVEEAITSGSAYSTIAAAAKPHSLLTLTGGSLGQGMPCAVGVAFACPDRVVISFNGDGAAMYTPQSLWMQARDNLNITTLICSNRSYDILKLEYHRAGNKDPEKNTTALMTLDNPSIDWVKMSESMGVPAESVTSSAQLAEALKTAIASPGPHLIEMVM